MRKGLGGAGRHAGPALALACALAMPFAAAQAQSKAAYRDQSEILRLFPEQTGLVSHGAQVRLTNGAWLDITDNPFGPAAPELCWFAPALHVAGICQSGQGVTVVMLFDLHSGHRVTAPGVPRLMPDPTLIAIGPDKALGVTSDSVTMVRVEKNDLIDQGGALFDDDFGPGDWVDGDCYRLTGKRGGWLERAGKAGWEQVEASKSKVCQKRHGR